MESQLNSQRKHWGNSTVPVKNLDGFSGGNLDGITEELPKEMPGTITERIAAG